MKIKTQELTGAALDWAVCKAAGLLDAYPNVAKNFAKLHAKGTTAKYIFPSTDWSQGGTIIEREGIEIQKGNPLYFPKGNENGDYYEPLWIAGKMHGSTPLIAAMRCYVASKLGEEIDVPEGL